MIFFELASSLASPGETVGKTMQVLVTQQKLSRQRFGETLAGSSRQLATPYRGGEMLAIRPGESANVLKKEAVKICHEENVSVY